MQRDIAPIHPGEVLKEDFLDEYGLSQYELAKRINVPAPRINAIVLGKRGISADTALRLGRFFGNSPQFWLNLQNHHDLHSAEEASGNRGRLFWLPACHQRALSTQRLALSK